MPQHRGSNGAELNGFESLPAEKKCELTEDQKKQLSTVKGKERDLRNWLRSRKDFSEEEKGALECQDYRQFSEYWTKISLRARSDFNRGRKQGWRKWALKYQSFGAGVLGFMKDWEPLIGIIKGAGGGYGDMAVGTISLIFVVARNKEQAESYLSDALSSIKDRMLGFSMYEDIYSENGILEKDLRAKIIRAYSSFVNLAIEAVRYYKGGGSWRWLRIIGEPRKFKELAVEVETQIVSIRLRSEELLSRNVSDIKEYNRKLITEVEQLQQANDYSRLTEIHRVWKLGRFSPEQKRNEELATYRRILSDHLPEDYDQFRAGDFKRLKFEASNEYNEWKRPANSKLLVLIGHTEPSIAEFQYYCWLSPVVLDLVEQRQKSEEFYAYYLLPTKRYMPLHDVMVSLLFQLLRFKSTILRDEDQYASLINLYEELNAETSKWSRIDALENLAQQVTGLFTEEENVWILIDRVDKCEKGDRLALLNILGRMVDSARCTLKVMVVVSGSDWAFDPKELDKKYRAEALTYEEEQERTEDVNDY